MNNQELIELIEREWDLENGFLGKLRQGRFDREDHQRCKQSLETMLTETRSTDNLPRRLVSLVWYIPLFMTWQAERVRGAIDSQEYQRVTTEIEGKIEEILGVP